MSDRRSTATQDLPPAVDWTLKHAATVVEGALRRALGDAGYKRRQQYILQHDHWQGGVEWIGPRGSPETERMVLSAVGPQFTPNDVVSEGLDNAEDGLFTVEPRLTLVPLDPIEDEGPAADAQAAEIDEIVGDLAHWWDAVGLWEVVSQAFRNSLWSTRGPLRLRIPAALLEARDDGGYRLPTGLDRREALERIRLSAPDPDRARVWEDPDTLATVGVYLFKDGDDDLAEVWIEEAGQVSFAIVGKDGIVGDGPTPLPEGVRLPMIEIRSPLLVTDPVLRQQQRLNFFETLLVRVAETAGFPERYFLDVDPPGVWVQGRPVNGDYLDVREGDSGTEYKVPVPLEMGAAIANFLQGVTYGRDDEPQRAAPSVAFRDPTDPDYVIRLAKHGRRTVLESMKQGHMAGDSAAEASGVAYQQNRARFESWLKRRKASVEAAVRDVVVAALELSDAMGSAARVLERYRVRVDLTVNAGPVLPDQTRATAELYAARLRSRATALAETGVEDVSAEEVALELEATTDVDRRLERKKQQSAIIAEVGQIASVRGAAKFAELENDDVDALAELDFDVTEQ